MHWCLFLHEGLTGVFGAVILLVPETCCDFATTFLYEHPDEVEWNDQFTNCIRINVSSTFSSSCGRTLSVAPTIDDSSVLNSAIIKPLSTVFRLLTGSMVPHTRRHFLQVATAVTGSLAGCSSLSSNTTQVSDSASENNRYTAPGDSTESDPPRLLLRSESEDSPLQLTDSKEKHQQASARGLSSHLTHTLIDTQSKAQHLTVADSSDSDQVSSFVAATDFDSETLYLESKRVQECFRLQLCNISWQSKKVRTHYVRTLRSYDERCAVDKHAIESRLIRFPATLDEESVNAHGSSISGSSQCGTPGGVDAEGSGGGQYSGESTNRGTNGGK